VIITEQGGLKKYYFVTDGSSVPVMVDWQFDDTIQDSSENSLEHIEVTVILSEGQKRWCTLCTKSIILSGIENQIIVKNFREKWSMMREN
jgi:hypothetical protein